MHLCCLNHSSKTAYYKQLGGKQPWSLMFDGLFNFTSNFTTPQRCFHHSDLSTSWCYWSVCLWLIWWQSLEMTAAFFNCGDVFVTPPCLLFIINCYFFLLSTNPTKGSKPALNVSYYKTLFEKADTSHGSLLKPFFKHSQLCSRKQSDLITFCTV